MEFNNQIPRNHSLFPPPLNPPVAKTGMGNPFYQASNGGLLEGYGKRRVSPKVSSGRETR